MTAPNGRALTVADDVQNATMTIGAVASEIGLSPSTLRVWEAAGLSSPVRDAAGRQVLPRTANQEAYVEAIRTHDLVIGSGPAGTGKTYLAVAAAVHLLRSGRVRKLVLVRPAIEAGEKLGFLPGDLQAKVNPYLRPLHDALFDMMDAEKAGRLMERGVIEVAPLAFMRGRTLNDAFVILDEAQNTTSEQMKMFLTRLGFGSKAVVTGDITQIDLPNARMSGLVEALKIVREADGCSQPGELGALLRREGLYSSNLVTWRRARDRGELVNAPKRGRKPKPVDPSAKRVAELERQNAKLLARAERAEALVELQKKVAALLGRPFPSEES